MEALTRMRKQALRLGLALGLAVTVLVPLASTPAEAQVGPHHWHHHYYRPHHWHHHYYHAHHWRPHHRWHR